MKGIALGNNTLSSVPLGTVIMFAGSLASLSVHWQLCDGTNGTPDLTTKFIMGTVVEGEIGTLGGSNDAVAVSHNHTFAGAALPPHDHDMGGYWHECGSSGGGRLHQGNSTHTTADSAGTPTGTVSTDGVSGVGLNVPSHVKLVHIQRII